MSNLTAVTPATGELLLVTPQMSTAWLAHNENRDERKANVQYFVRIIKGGFWEVTTDAVGLEVRADGTEVLRNGQHRLRAIEITGEAQWLFVVRGITPTAMSAIDTGKKRTLGDVLKLNYGVTEASEVAAVVRLAYYVENGNPNMVATGGGREVPPALLLDWYTKHPEVKEAQVYGKHIYKSVGLSRASCAVAKMLFDRVDPNETDEFFTRVRTGVGLSEGDPILALRAWIANQRASRDVVPRPSEQLAVIIKTWNDWSSGKSRKFVKYNRNVEAFPVVVGLPVDTAVMSATA